MEPPEFIQVILVLPDDFFATQWITWPSFLASIFFAAMTLYLFWLQWGDYRREQVQIAVSEKRRTRQHNDDKKWVNEMTSATASKPFPIQTPAPSVPVREASEEELARAREQGSEIFSQLTSIKSLQLKKKALEQSQSELAPSSEAAELESKIFDTKSTEAVSDLKIEETQSGKFSRMSLGGEFIFDAEDSQKNEKDS